MITLRLLLSFLLSFFISYQCIACTCDCFGHTLCTLIKQDSTLPVIHGNVIDFDQGTYRWTVEVLEQFAGIKVSDTIIIEMPHPCSEPLKAIDDLAKPGDEVMARIEYHDTIPSRGYATYIQYSCNYIHLSIDGVLVTGNISSNVKSMSIDEFRSYTNGEFREDVYCRTCLCDCEFDALAPYMFVDSTFCLSKKLALKKYPDALVARIRILDIDSVSVMAHIEEVLLGEELDTVIEIAVRQGKECRLRSSAFEIGEEYVSILPKIRTGDVIGPNQREGDYFASSCGNQHLLIENEEVNDVIATKILKISYPDLKEEIKNGFANVKNCYDWISSVSSVEISEIDIYPNPAMRRVTIDGEGLLLDRIELFDLKGRMVFQSAISQSRQIEFEIPEGLSGIHLIKVRSTSGYSLTRKLMITGK